MLGLLPEITSRGNEIMREKIRIKPPDKFDLIWTFVGNTMRTKGNNQKELEQNLKDLLHKYRGYLIERDDIFLGKRIEKICPHCKK